MEEHWREMTSSRQKPEKSQEKRARREKRKEENGLKLKGVEGRRAGRRR